MDVRPASTLEGELSSDVLARLDSQMGRTVNGHEKDVRTKIYEGLSREEVLHAVETFSIPTGLGLFDELERAAANKFGSFSVRGPYSENRSRVEQYFANKVFEISDSIVEKALSRVSRLLPPRSLSASTLVKAFENAPSGTNWGLPYYSSDTEDYPLYLRDIEEIKRSGWKKEKLWPCVLGVRSQPNGIGEASKWRPLWMAGHAAILAELAIQQPLLKALSKIPTFVAWTTPGAIALRVTQILKGKRRKRISSDMSHYDASLTIEIIRGVFDLIRYWFEDKDQDHIDWIEYLFLNVELLTPDGLLSGREGSVPSGLGMTNMVDTLGQIVMDEVVAIVTDCNVTGIYLGDDGFKEFSNPDVDPEVYSSIYSKMNMVVSVDKSSYSDSYADFLQRRHTISYQVNGICVGFRSQIRTACGVISQEYDRPLGPAMVAVRAVQQVEQCGDNPNFDPLVHWLVAGSVYLYEHGAHTAVKSAGGIGKIEDVLRLRSYPYDKRDVRKWDSFKTVRLIDDIRNQELIKGLPITV